jgi:transposase
MLLKYSVGLDVSKDKIDAALCSIDFEQVIKYKSTTSFNNTNAGFKNLCLWVKKWTSNTNVSVSICLEATGVYHEKCAYYLNDNGFSFSVILPNKAKRYLQSLGLKSKNDKIDAKGLARMGAEQKLDLWVRPNDFYMELRSLTRQHQSIQETITSERNKLHSEKLSATTSSKQIVQQIKSLINLLNKQKKEIEKAIKKHIESNAEMKRKMDNVLKVKGIGILSASTVIAETLGFDQFSNYKQVVSYAGYDVVENQSGNRYGKTKISKKGNSRIRRILHMPSLSAKQVKNSVYAQLFERIFERTGIKMKGIVAVQKKLLLTIYYLWKKEIQYEESYYKHSKKIAEVK